MTRKLLTSDRLVFMALFFGFASGFLIVIASALLLNTFDRIGVSLMFVLVAVLLWIIGFRHRCVWLQDGQVTITWGKRFAIPLRRYDAKDLTYFSITKEQRFVVMHTYGTGVNRAVRAPDRFRLRARRNGRTVNLGSYETQQSVEAAQQLLTSV